MFDRFLFGGLGAALTGVVVVLSGALGAGDATPPEPTPVLSEIPALPAGSHVCADPDFKPVEMADRDDLDRDGHTIVLACQYNDILVYLNQDGSFATARVGKDGDFIFDEEKVPEWGD